MSEFDIHFPTYEGAETGQYRLMELPQELLPILQDSTAANPLTIRGRGEDDAVLCTATKTYTIRSITLSNSFCVLTPPNPGQPGDAVIRDNVQQILEIAPSIPRLYRLTGLLRGREYDEGLEQEKGESYAEKLTPWTLEDVKSDIQASDAEFEESLKQKYILILNGGLRPISPAYLNTILELLLNTLVSSSYSPSGAPAADIADNLECDHDVSRDVSMQVMSWFGELTQDQGDGNCNSLDKTWKVDVDAAVKQLGLGILSAYRGNTTIRADELLKKWRLLVGDSFESRVDLSLLLGNYIVSPQSSSSTAVLAYFPSSELPIAPSERFADLFLTQARWKASDIVPFLSDIAFDDKERDRLLLKFTRSTTDKEGAVWYTSRGV